MKVWENTVESIIGFVGTIALGFFFYALRIRRRLAYGLLEVLAAVLVIYFVFFPIENSYLMIAEADISPIERLLSMSAGMLAGVYILVRGLDNIDQDLPAGWRFVWDRVFRGKAA
jgi:hypothetical protein